MNKIVLRCKMLSGRGSLTMPTKINCLSKKKEKTTCIGKGNSEENPNRFNVKRARKRDNISTQSYFAPCFLRKAKPA